MFTRSSHILFAIMAAGSPVSVYASPLDFDCDVPADRYSSISQAADKAFSIGGAVKLKAARSGANLPVAGVRFLSVDGKASAGFQIILNDEKSTQFDVIMNVNVNGELKKYPLGQISVDENIPFKFHSEPSGKIEVSVGENSMESEFSNISAGRIMLFCSTGQFKFSEVEFGGLTAR